MRDLRDSERLAAIDALFDAALERPPEERPGWLDERCAADHDLRAEVEELLRLAEQPMAALDSAGGIGETFLYELGTSLEARPVAAPGERVGPWRLLREIGAGGMGTVYLAERADGEFEQRVALKVLATSLEGSNAVERFEQERQILAALEHPNIARLLDGGRTEGGRPYFVMEYVEGQPIDRYCRDQDLDLAARLELFARVGAAVQYAHQKLVVHRDIKPANIVATSDGAVKLLDFGIAKPLSEAAPGLTRTLARVLTPEYGSPEQVRGQPVSAASDVYQLGLLLYELLTGQRAHRFADTSPAAIEQGICERHPDRPSTVVRSTDDRPIPMAPSALARALSGDLDTIVLKALRKEPERRYQSVASLLDDLERYREGRPIRARPDTFGYRAGKFIGRHRPGLAAATTAFVVVAALTVFYTARLRAERDRVQTEAEKSRAALEFVLGTFSPLDPVLASGQADTSTRELLARSVESAQRDLGSQPQVQAALLDAFGRTYRNLGLLKEGEAVILAGLDIRRRVLPPGHRDIGLSLANLASARLGLTAHEDALENIREAIEILRSTDETGVDLAQAVKTQANVHAARGEFDLALPAFDEAIALLETEGAGGARLLLRTLHDRATLMFDLGDYAAAADQYGAVARASRAYPSGIGTPLPWALGGQGASITALGRFTEGEALLREALDLMQERFDGDHPEFADYERALATNLARQDRLAEAETHYRNTIEIFGRTYGPRHHEIAKTLYDLAALQRRRRQFVQARESIDGCLDILGDLLPPTHPHMGRATAGAAWIELESGASASAAAKFEKSLAILEAALAPDHSLVIQTRTGRASARHALGQEREACSEWHELEALAAGAQLQDEARDRLAGLVAGCG